MKITDNLLLATCERNHAAMGACLVTIFESETLARQVTMELVHMLTHAEHDRKTLAMKVLTIEKFPGINAGDEMDH